MGTKNPNPGLTPWVTYKNRGFDPTPTPLRLFWVVNSLTTYEPRGVIKIKDPKGQSPNSAEPFPG